MNGAVSIESEEGKGTTVIVSLPCIKISVLDFNRLKDYIYHMRFSVLFLIFIVSGFAVFGVLGMMEGMEHGHGFCFAASAGPFCSETISAFFSHLAGFQKLSVSMLQKIFILVFTVLLYAALRLSRHRAYSRFIFSFPSRIFRQDFLLRFVAANEKKLSWLAFHEQSPAGFSDA